MKVKNYLFVIAILVGTGKANAQCENPRIFNNQLDVKINFENSHLNISGLHCDICIYGLEGSNICECRKDCDLSEEQENEMEECIEDCEVRYYNDPVYLDYCLDGCEDYEQSIIDDCQDECGNLPEEQREVVNYDVQLNIWYNTGFTETFAGQPNVIAGTPVLFGAPPNTVTVNLNHEFPNKPISYCYVVRTVLVYDDGTCCVYFDFECVNLG